MVKLKQKDIMTIEKAGCNNKYQIVTEIFQTKKKTNKKDIQEVNTKYFQKTSKI